MNAKKTKKRETIALQELKQKHHSLKIDLFILQLLQKKLENKITGYIDIKQIYQQSDIQQTMKFLDCDLGDLEKRIFYNIGAGFIELEPLDDEDTLLVTNKCYEIGLDPNKMLKEERGIMKIKTEAYYEYFLPIKITSAGLNQIEIIKQEIRQIKRKLSWFYFLLDKGKFWLQSLSTYKQAIGILISIFIVFIAFFSQLSIQNLLSQFPFLASIADEDVLNIDKIQENYKEIDTKDPFFNFANTFLDKSALMFFLENKIQNIQVKPVTSTSKIYKITFTNNTVRYVLVKKENGKFKLHFMNPDTVIPGYE